MNFQITKTNEKFGFSLEQPEEKTATKKTNAKQTLLKTESQIDIAKIKKLNKLENYSLSQMKTKRNSLNLQLKNHSKRILRTSPSSGSLSGGLNFNLYRPSKDKSIINQKNLIDFGLHYSNIFSLHKNDQQKKRTSSQELNLTSTDKKKPLQTENFGTSLTFNDFQLVTKKTESKSSSDDLLKNNEISKLSQTTLPLNKKTKSPLVKSHTINNFESIVNNKLPIKERLCYTPNPFQNFSTNTLFLQKRTITLQPQTILKL